MPAAPKASHTRKSGAPKAKGAVRAKSGCYTCRIRRKKCDEQQDDRQRCQTCVRLHLQCLGFGSKRPEWLRENRNVVELRDKIKSFLAAQGMIKGHSGSGPRNSENNNEPRILQLTEDQNHSSSSESPQSRSVSIPSDDYYRAPASSVRDLPWESVYTPGLQTAYADSPGSSSTASTHHQSSYPMPTTSNSLVSSSFAQRSSFPGYYYPPELFLGLEEAFGADDGCYDNQNALPIGGFRQYAPGVIDELVKHYMENVIDIQYLLGDKKNLHEMIFRSLDSHDTAREAVKLLASVHDKRFKGQLALDWETDRRLAVLQNRLNSAPPTANDAMAALHIVSLYLFDGGRGAWNDFLSIAAHFVDAVLNNPHYRGPADALMHCDPTVAFVIKTAIWFDVIASITTQCRPHFATSIKKMFDPSLAPYYPTPQFSMMSPMGCENNVLWALSQASDLSFWKREQERKGSLSVPELVKRAETIETVLNHQVVSTMPLSNDDNTDISRRLTSEIFHKSTQLFLQSVVSGDHPNVHELKRSVDETINVIQKLCDPKLTDTIYRSVVRSTVFAFYICGALTDKPKHRQTLLDILGRESGDNSSVGNCNSIRTLLENIWRNRTGTDPSQPVDWRGKLKEDNSQILLV